MTPNTHIAVIRRESPDQAFVYTVASRRGRAAAIRWYRAAKLLTVNRRIRKTLKLEDGALCIPQRWATCTRRTTNLCNYVTQPLGRRRQLDAYTSR